MQSARTFPLFVLCLLLMAALPGWISPAAAQQEEKRIALVIGNGAYEKAPLATTANDAGLIAQTLQAAGFDVIGARDLDGDMLRKSFRDFIQKAESSGANTVAVAKDGLPTRTPIPPDIAAMTGIHMPASSMIPT